MLIAQHLFYFCIFTVFKVSDSALHELLFSFRKEVIQPQVPLRLPCYDFILVTSVALALYFPKVMSSSLGDTSFHDVTGGVYKTRERIHGTVADMPLLAIPTSCRRIAACNLN